MSRDVVDSLRRALVEQGWIYADRFYRKGNPFVWVDGPLTHGQVDFDGTIALARYMSGYYELYETPASIRIPDYEDALAVIYSAFKDVFSFYFPYISLDDSRFEHFIKCNAIARLQDYGFLRTFCKDLPAQSIHHLDFGPGMGVHSTYSVRLFKGVYSAVEVDPGGYNTQRLFFRALLRREDRGYLDLIDCEQMGLSQEAIAKALADNDKYRIKHVPSWYFPLISSESHDLITATACLNEITAAGIIWMAHHTSRVLKTGGYLYIRDSGQLKPLRHSIDYDSLFQELGFSLVKRLDVRNRIDMYGIPRAYKKVRTVNTTFDDLFDRCLGRFAVLSHGGAHVYNIGGKGNAT